ncbi:competence protein CoiA [Marinococcus luteus]|uniref:competence protein CoiA n=1 Tax=Marinococcus luteus TaxID=1122204 RepID=UPI002ACCE2DC|nr:competence protein CoiA family protein [Marinococcus luteus]MDZ5783638.1 competence protein CoiA family protein [Marinococcus luteus]
MFNALIANGRAVSSLDPTIYPPYYCPDCGHEVHLRNKSNTRPHFVHSRSADCRLPGGESEEHTEGKALLASWLKKQNLSPVIEKQLPEEGRRADVFVQWTGRNVALEIQRSAIDSPQLLTRSRTYREKGILPLWFFAPKLVQRKNAGRWFWNEAVWSSLFSGYFNAVPVLMPSSRELLIVQPLFEASPKRIVACALRFPVGDIKLEYFFTPAQLSFSFNDKILAHKNSWRFSPHQFTGCEKYWESLGIYTRHYSHISMHPADLGWPTPYCYVFRGPPLVWQTLLFHRIIHQKNDTLNNILILVQKDPLLAPLIRSGLRAEVYLRQAVWHFLQWLKVRKTVYFHHGRWHLKKDLLSEASAEKGWSQDQSIAGIFTAYIKKLEA